MTAEIVQVGARADVRAAVARGKETARPVSQCFPHQQGEVRDGSNQGRAGRVGHGAAPLSAVVGMKFNHRGTEGTEVGPEGENRGLTRMNADGSRQDAGGPRREEAVGARKAAEILQKGFPNVLVPRWGEDVSLEEWYWKELREGGVLKDYLEMEKRQVARRYRKVAQQMDGFAQNNKSDFQLKAAVPARDYFRWKAEDPHFFEDDKNLRSLRRDNPDVFVKV